MKQFIVIACVLLGMVSCKTEEEAVTTTVEEQVEEPMEVTNRLVGIVHVSEEGCPVEIEAKMNSGEMLALYPIDLEDKYKVEGMRIRFTYAVSRAPQPDGCSADMTVSLSDVTRLR